MLCEYGCNKEALFRTKQGKNICSKSPTQCPINRKKNSEGIKKAYKEGRKTPHNFGGNSAWAKGLSCLIDKRVQAKIPIEKIFSENSYASTAQIRIWIIKHSLLEYKCQGCKISKWNNKEIALELDHINGANTDNRLENLRFLCPNCHSQTDTYRGRGAKGHRGRLKVSEEKILEIINKCKSIREILLRVGLAAKGGNYSRIKAVMLKRNIKYESDYGLYDKPE